MAKYKMEVIDANWKTVKFEQKALDAQNAKEIALTFHKGGQVTKCIRIGKNTASTRSSLEGFRSEYLEAMSSGKTAVAERHKIAYEATVESLLAGLNVVAKNIVKKAIPPLEF